MIKPLKIPRGVAYLFCQDHVSLNIVNEETQFRPDFINNSMVNEVINNHISNVSPITLVKKTAYFVTDVLFMGYFRRI